MATNTYYIEVLTPERELKYYTVIYKFTDYPKHDDVIRGLTKACNHISQLHGGSPDLFIRPIPPQDYDQQVAEGELDPNTFERIVLEDVS